MGLGKGNCSELWGVLVGGLQGSENESAESRSDKMVRCVDGMGALLRTLTWFQIAN